MKQKKILDNSLIFLIVGIVLSIILAVLVTKGYGWINPEIEVVVPNGKDIAANTVIKSSHLTTKKVSKSIIETQKIYTNPQDLVGKVAKSIIPEGTPITSKHILDLQAENKNVLTAKLSSMGDTNLIAYTVPVDSLDAVGGKISANDMVYLIGAFNSNLKTGEKNSAMSKVIVPAARVIETVEKDKQIRGITIAITPEEAVDIAYVLKNGTISIALLPYQYQEKDINLLITDSSSFNEKNFTEE